MSFQKPLVNIALVSFITSEKKLCLEKVRGFFSPLWLSLVIKESIYVHDLRKGPAYCELLSDLEL